MIAETVIDTYKIFSVDPILGKITYDYVYKGQTNNNRITLYLPLVNNKVITGKELEEFILSFGCSHGNPSGAAISEMIENPEPYAPNKTVEISRKDQCRAVTNWEELKDYFKPIV